ncbi:extracellular solute-binding protein [Lapidilactobacillus wuchangensis]|uniref:extracellular solute-binding protein n=1 Tax=Lapidilactobacillus wuchangensis TaxID=2486001 RepID=UPI000F76FC12|nr:extracellular solute-binding protein [Lapidilactobacillus wuchangensis]
MKKFARILIGAAAVLSLGAVLTGCGKKSDSSSQQTLKVSIDPSYKSYMKTMVPKFEKKYNAKVNVTYKAMLDASDALQLDGPSGKGPDVLIMSNGSVGGKVIQGLVAPVKLDKSRYSGTVADSTKYKGKYYGAPIVIESIIMYYNKKFVTKPATTFGEIEKLSKDPKFAYENDKTKNVAFLAQWTNFYTAYGLIKGYGGYVFGKDNTNPKDIGLNNDGAVKGLDYIANWYKNTWPTGLQNATSNENLITQQFTSNKTAYVLDGPWMAASYKKAGVDFGATTIPTLPNGKAYQPFGGGKSWVISAYTKNKSLSQKWLDFITNDANQKSFFKETGEVPANKVANADAAKSNNEVVKAVVDESKHTIPAPNIPEMSEVWTPAQSMITNAASGKYTAKAAADKGVTTIKQNIKQKYNK